MKTMRMLLLGAVALGACSPATARSHSRSQLLPAPPATTTTAGPTPTTTIAAVAPRTPLTAALDAVLSNTDSCVVVRSDRGRTLYTRNAATPFAPASTQKLLVAAAALDELGPGYRFVTSVVAARHPLAGIVGDLWLVGGGDPLLASPEYIAALRSNPVTGSYAPTAIVALADQLRAGGVRVVVGGIHGDDGRFDRERYLSTWAPSINRGEFDVGPLGALEVDQGLDRWTPAVPTADPAGHGAGVLARLLGDRGVRAVQASDGAAPPGGVVLAAVQSAPLTEIVTAMLQASDNQIAELLTRELDRHAGGQGTTAGGVRRIMADAAGLGLPVGGLSLVDGSGLSRADRVTCSTLLGALDVGSRPRYAAMSSALPVAGTTGSLYNVFRDTSLAGRLAAKGGYITGVTAMVGRIGDRRFAFVANGDFGYTAGLALTQTVVQAIAA